MRKLNMLFLACGLVVVAGVLIVSRQHLSAQSAGNTALLYSFVTNQAGFDTGLVITNASLNPFGTTGRAGTCIISYYGNVVGLGFAPAPQTTTVIPAGGQVTFTLSGGGGAGIAATPGFQGYVIATCNFPQAQGLAAVTDPGAAK